MKVAIFSYENKRFRAHDKSDAVDGAKVQLVLGFGAKSILAAEQIHAKLKSQFPVADIVLCSTSGEIFNDMVLDDSVSVTALEFEHTCIRAASVDIDDFQGSFAAGEALMKDIPASNELCYVMVIADGGKVNGSELVNGIEAANRHKVLVTGGLAGDGANFVSTLAGLNQEPASGKIVVIAFYGDRLRVAHGSMGGWEGFGPEKTITK